MISQYFKIPCLSSMINICPFLLQTRAVCVTVWRTCSEPRTCPPWTWWRCSSPCSASSRTPARSHMSSWTTSSPARATLTFPSSYSGKPKSQSSYSCTPSSLRSYSSTPSSLSSYSNTPTSLSSYSGKPKSPSSYLGKPKSPSSYPVKT